MHLLLIFLMGLIGAGIGWITNVIAIRLLFRPQKEYQIPLLGWRIQGLLPKRQKEVAQALGEIVSNELVTGNDLLASLKRKDLRDNLHAKLEKYVRERVILRLPFSLPANYLAELIVKILSQEVDSFLNNPARFFGDDAELIRLEIQRIVEEKVLALEINDLEEMVYALARTELKHIEIVGGILGLIIGIVQGIISLFWSGWIS